MILTDSVLKVLYVILPFCAALLIGLDNHRRKRGGSRRESGALLLVSLFLTIISILFSLYLRNSLEDTAFLVLPPLLTALSAFGSAGRGPEPEFLPQEEKEA